MKLTIDLRSALLGLLTGVTLVFLVGAAANNGVNTGRFQAALADDGGAALVIDTATGRVWRNRDYSSLSNHKDFFEPKIGNAKDQSH